MCYFVTFFLVGFFLFFTFAENNQHNVKFTNVNLILKVMKNSSNYRVRVLFYVGYKLHDESFSVPDYQTAVDRFLFYVRAALELGVSLRCVNIMKGKKCIKMFQNH